MSSQLPQTKGSDSSGGYIIPVVAQQPPSSSSSLLAQPSSPSGNATSSIQTSQQLPPNYMSIMTTSDTNVTNSSSTFPNDSSPKDTTTSSGSTNTFQPNAYTRSYSTRSSSSPLSNAGPSKDQSMGTSVPIKTTTSMSNESNTSTSPNTNGSLTTSSSVSSPPSGSDASLRPSLTFVNGSNDYQAEFTCHPDFRLNTKTKNPPNTKFNVSIKDVLFVTGVDLGDCEMFLRLDNGSAHGQPVCSCFFKPLTPYIDSSTNKEKKKRLYQAKIDIPPSLNTKKGSSSSRVGFIEIYDSNNKLVAVSDKFWIRSRSRDQMLKDETTKKRARSNQQAFRKNMAAMHHHAHSSNGSGSATFTSSTPSSMEPSLKKIKPTPISRSIMSPLVSSPQPPQNVISPNSASHSRQSSLAFSSPQPQRFTTSIQNPHTASSFDVMGSPGRTQASSSMESPQLVLPSSSNLKPESHTLPPLREIFSPQMTNGASSSSSSMEYSAPSTTPKQGGGGVRTTTSPNGTSLVTTQHPIRSIHQQQTSGFATKPQHYPRHPQQGETSTNLLYPVNHSSPIQDSTSMTSPENLLRTLEDSLRQQQDQIQELMRLTSSNAQAISRMQEKLQEIMLNLSSAPNSNP
ncbi:hypothetical protein C9374_008496 [Naegleria lovaniensis]|uniref:Uncharacterized protein n=1 Tax=Naegleria lovaniensis TaxID=51637 RepID=A0AA88GLG9_NAELO|nr:uncharacterized protein C9374_008496 [Naegleria lovaniensis]KAG2378353.1 hypothetical protein C9374_008496 [Naegleria lovaniensis]